MAYYWATFRIHKDATYDDRYNKMVEAINSIDKGRWSETTSFYLIEYTGDAASLARKISAPLNSAADMLVVKHLSEADAAYFGKVNHPDVLLSFIPGAKKLA